MKFSDDNLNNRLWVFLMTLDMIDKKEFNKFLLKYDIEGISDSYLKQISLKVKESWVEEISEILGGRIKKM